MPVAPKGVSVADIVKVIGEKKYEFRETSTDAQWELKEELDSNEYHLTVCKFGDDWFGTVNVKLKSGATMNFTQKDLSSHEVLIRRLVDQTVRYQQLLVPQPKEF